MYQFYIKINSGSFLYSQELLGKQWNGYSGTRVRFVQWKKGMIGHRIKAGVKTIRESAAGRAQLLRSRQNLISLWSTVAPVRSPCRFANEKLSLDASLEQPVGADVPLFRFGVSRRLIKAPLPLHERSLCSLRHARPERFKIDTPGWHEAEETRRGTHAIRSADSHWS